MMDLPDCAIAVMAVAVWMEWHGSERLKEGDYARAVRYSLLRRGVAL